METESDGATLLAAMTDEQVVSHVMEDIRKMFPLAPDPDGSIVYRMEKESFQQGGFTYLPPHTNREMQDELGGSMWAGRVLFAGEHCSAIHPGTVHGAVVSGYQAAAELQDAACAQKEGARKYLSLYMKQLMSFQRKKRWFLPGWMYEEEEQEDEYFWDRNP